MSLPTYCRCAGKRRERQRLALEQSSSRGCDGRYIGPMTGHGRLSVRSGLAQQHTRPGSPWPCGQMDKDGCREVWSSGGAHHMPEPASDGDWWAWRPKRRLQDIAIKTALPLNGCPPPTTTELLCKLFFIAGATTPLRPCSFSGWRALRPGCCPATVQTLVPAPL